MASIKLSDRVYRYNAQTRVLEISFLSDYLDTVPEACWPDGAGPKYRREGTQILWCRFGKVEVLRDWGCEKFAQSVLEDLYVEAILEGPHFDSVLTASEALDQPCFDALDGPRAQIVEELLRLERMGSGLAAEWLIETAGMSDSEFNAWKQQP